MGTLQHFFGVFSHASQQFQASPYARDVFPACDPQRKSPSRRLVRARASCFVRTENLARFPLLLRSSAFQHSLFETRRNLETQRQGGAEKDLGD